MAGRKIEQYDKFECQILCKRNKSLKRSIAAVVWGGGTDPNSQ
jgi:hypothetical protein